MVLEGDRQKMDGQRKTQVDKDRDRHVDRMSEREGELVNLEQDELLLLLIQLVVRNLFYFRS